MDIKDRDLVIVLQSIIDNIKLGKISCMNISQSRKTLRDLDEERTSCSMYKIFKPSLKFEIVLTLINNSNPNIEKVEMFREANGVK